jgi:hypothetical protein
LGQSRQFLGLARQTWQFSALKGIGAPFPTERCRSIWANVPNAMNGMVPFADDLVVPLAKRGDRRLERGVLRRDAIRELQQQAYFGPAVFAGHNGVKGAEVLYAQEMHHGHIDIHLDVAFGPAARNLPA